MSRGGLLRGIDDIRNGRLHPEREFVRLDSSRKLRIVGVLRCRQPVQSAEKLLRFQSLRRTRTAGGNRERQRVLRIDGQSDSVMFGPEIIRAFRPLAAAAVADLIPHHDELRKTVIQRAQSVVNPGPDRWEEAVKPVSAGVKLKLSVVVAGGGPH